MEVKHDVMAPILFSQELTDFFAIADVGYYIEGQLKGFHVQRGSLKQTGHRLNNYLYSTRPTINNQPNPSYRIFRLYNFIDLFGIHAYYTQMRIPNTDPDELRRYSASNQMRQHLRQTMVNAILKDVQEMLTGNINNVQLLDQVTLAIPRLIANIDDPTNVNPNEGIVGNTELFNPNYFTYKHFSKLVNAAKEYTLNQDDIMVVDSDIQRVYQNIIPEFSSLKILLTYQESFVKLAQAYKNTTRRVIIQ